ncbi:HD-GYP domain-containing protein [Uliginosibacterium sp. H1]|uniref:HD-GYP domain-containing protein n=1 Tax=Uliginosibacterium sp. H1 TaxID=3114757 RepID=UPI002E177508|nr:HD domain-containing phosphohydrolase [Uliginosibacterium sp. H1]
MNRKPAPPRLIEVDTPLPWDLYDTRGNLLLCEGYKLKRESERDVLLARTPQVDGHLLPDDAPTPPPPATGAAPRRAETRSDPFRLWRSIVSELEDLLRHVLQREDFTRDALNIARLVQTLTTHNADTALAAIVLADQRRYPIVHSLHVAILCELVASRLGWDEARRDSLGCAAITMNLAMLTLQAQLCVQRTAPTPQQRQAIDRHPQLGEEVLKRAGVTDENWLRAVLEHHEKPGGGGYPYGIGSPSEEAQLIQTADVFSAKLSPRAARAPMAPQEAARSLYLGTQNAESNPYVAVMIKEIGIFPPGTFVQLANGETAMVLRRGSTANTPYVMSLLSASGVPFDRPVRRDTGIKAYEVASVMPRDKLQMRFNIETMWQVG